MPICYLLNDGFRIQHFYSISKSCYLLNDGLKIQNFFSISKSCCLQNDWLRIQHFYSISKRCCLQNDGLCVQRRVVVVRKRVHEMIVENASGGVQRVDNEERLPLDGLPVQGRVLGLSDLQGGLKPRQVIHLCEVCEWWAVNDVTVRPGQDGLLRPTL